MFEEYFPSHCSCNYLEEECGPSNDKTDRNQNNNNNNNEAVCKDVIPTTINYEELLKKKANLEEKWAAYVSINDNDNDYAYAYDFY